ncbi:MAG: efflux RND transporter periplasmic adaptor subunit [Calditrichaceae bacterium]|nr:efflux RND transporter periplasmic adaptor subunit [Calditrichaceae bacterium]RQV95166.1 MAG: efflux RND transporter periplasmic adaptor subunit [Calditrichota bacterium]
MKKIIILLIVITLNGCFSDSDEQSIYYGRADVDIIRLSAQSAGIIDSLAVDEGEQIRKNQVLAKINTERLEAQLRQQNAQLREIEESIIGLRAQLNQVEYQYQFTKETYEKTKKMVKDGAATIQNRDELETKVKVFEAQITGIRSQLKAAESKKQQIHAAIDITKLNLRDSRIVSPIDGIIINKFRHQGELVGQGMPILEAADLSEMNVMIYVSFADLSKIKIGQEVEVIAGEDEKTMKGRIKWISSESEFTPKTILTKEVRTTLVYAVKVAVPNGEGILKIGMPVDVRI